ncbi:hypothetical protein K439DRAFT_368369 [Ramaria rubella]|nr:hypothetical protein K439DRAFT_368369 [Ramaria rubella]
MVNLSANGHLYRSLTRRGRLNRSKMVVNAMTNSFFSSAKTRLFVLRQCKHDSTNTLWFMYWLTTIVDSVFLFYKEVFRCADLTMTCKHECMLVHMFNLI